MSAAVTSPRHLKDTTIAVAQQSAYGTAAATSLAMQLFCSAVEVNPGFEYVNLRGTTGSALPKDMHFKTAERPEVNLEMPATKKNLIFFASHCIGLTSGTSAAGNLTLALNTGWSTLTLANILPHINTDDSWILYAKLTDGGGGTGHTFELYSDSGRTALVATGTGNDSATVTLTASNNSGLTGTVVLGAVSADDLDATVTVASVVIEPDQTQDKYITFWRDTGSNLERVIDCAVAKLVRKSQELGPVMLEVELYGSTHEGSLSTTLTPSLSTDDRDIYLHDSVVYTSDVDTDAVTESVYSVEVAITRNLMRDVHNASTAVAIWLSNFESIEMSVEQRFADEAKVVINSGLADAFTSERVVDTHDSKTATWLFDKAKVVNPQLPNSNEESYERVTHTLACVEETATSPSTALTLTVTGP